MAKQIVDWQDFPETDSIYLLEKGDVIVKQTQIMSMHNDLAFRLSTIDAQEYPGIHKIYLDLYTTLLDTIRGAQAWKTTRN